MGVKSEMAGRRHSWDSDKSRAGSRAPLTRRCFGEHALMRLTRPRFGLRVSGFFSPRCRAVAAGRISVFGLRIYLEPTWHWKCRGTGKRHSGVGCRPNPSLRSAGEQLGAVFRGRLAQQLFEDPVEMRERLEPDFKRDLAHAQVGIQQQVLRLLDAEA